MVKRWISSEEIANILGIAKRSVNRRAKTEGWTGRKLQARGGSYSVYFVSTLPDDIQRAYAASLSMDLQGA